MRGAARQQRTGSDEGTAWADIDHGRRRDGALTGDTMPFIFATVPALASATPGAKGSWKKAKVAMQDLTGRGKLPSPLQPQVFSSFS